MFYYDYYSLVIMLPLFIISFIIQLNLNSTYNRYKKINNSRNFTGSQRAMAILNSAGIYDVTVECVSGNLSDHFDPDRSIEFLAQARIQDEKDEAQSNRSTKGHQVSMLCANSDKKNGLVLTLQCAGGEAEESALAMDNDNLKQEVAAGKKS